MYILQNVPIGQEVGYSALPEDIFHKLRIVKKEECLELFFILERDEKEKAGTFYTEDALCEYAYSYSKKLYDCDAWLGGMMKDYPEDFLNKLKKCNIPATEYSFDGATPDCSYFVMENGKNYDVYYQDREQKIKLAELYKKETAYDFLYYLVMKKYVNPKNVFGKET